MTYSKSWQGRFVSGRATAPVLLGVSLLMWLVGIFLDAPVNDLSLFGFNIGNVVSRCITFACFALAGVMMSSLYIFDRRIRWFFSLFFYLAGVSLFMHGCVGYSLSLIPFLLIVLRVFACKQEEDCRYALFSAFAVFGLATMLFPQFIMLLPLFVFYISMTSLAGRRDIFSILLGLLTPYWFLFGIDYIFPHLIEQSGLFTAPFKYLISPTLSLPSLFDVFLLVVDLSVLIPFVFIFSGSSYPGKPLLRKRLKFFAWQNLYFVALAFLYANDYNLYYIWALPSLAVMLAYIFSLKVTRFSRFYFVLINLLLLAIAPLGLWLKQ